MTTVPGRVELTRVYHFSAAHRLENRALDAATNARLYGPCHRPHGHNYYLEVTVAGVPDAETGMAADLERLDALVDGSLLAHLDHQTLEEVPLLEGVISTGESLARAFFRTLAPALNGTLVQVAVIETAKNRFAWRGEHAADDAVLEPHPGAGTAGPAE